MIGLPPIQFVSEMELKNRHKQLENEIFTIRSHLSTLIVDPSYVDAHVQTTTNQLQPASQDGLDTRILKHKCQMLKAQIETLGKKEFITLPHDTAIEQCVLHESYRERIAQTNECWNFLQSYKNNLTQDIEREKKLRIELEALVHAAEEKLQETDQLSKKDVYKRLEEKCKKLDKMNKEKAIQMNQVLDKEYPLPDAESFTKVKKKMSTVTSVQNMTLDSLLPLKDIVKSLIESCLETPNDPYIVTDHRYWPPYIELLLECDIALRHPVDGSRIKLFPFYL